MASPERLFILAAFLISAGNIIGAFELPTAILAAIGIILFVNYRRRFVNFCKAIPRDVVAMKRLAATYKKLWKYSQNNWTLVDLFRIQLDKHPDKVCFYFEDQKWTYSDIEKYSNRVAHVFQQAGFRKGDVVALLMGNCIEYVCIWFGLAKIGVVTALINYNLKKTPLAHCIKTAQAKALIFCDEYQLEVQEISQDIEKVKKYQLGGNINDNEIAQLQTLVQNASKLPPILNDVVGFRDKLMYIYTSGTTGLPKAAIIPHHRYLMVSLAGDSLMNIREDDIVYNPLPLYHTAGGMIGTSGPLCHGNAAVIRKKFSASAYWTDCIRYGCTAGQYIGEMCRYILMVPPRPEDTQHKVRFLFGNGMRASIWKEFVDRFNLENIFEFYGSTEGNANIVNIDTTVGAVGFVPKILPSFLVPLALIKVDESGQPIRDKNGFCIRCKANEPGMFIGMIHTADATREYSGYVGDKKENEKKVIQHVFRKGDKAFLSGDILVMDELGYLYFKDRKGDTFRWKSENVSTTEVENVISTVAGHRDVTVYGVEVGNLEGRAGMATIVDTNGDLDLKSLAAELEKHLPAYARPLFLRITDHADMTGTFKLKKIDLQKEGFNPELIKDKLFFRNGKNEFVKLTKEMYDDIISGKIRV